MKLTEEQQKLMRELAKRGGKARAKKMSKAERKAGAQKAARARWDKVKKRRKGAQ